MTKEEKELLLKDLCVRLPYGVRCQWNNSYDGILVDICKCKTKDGFVYWDCYFEEYNDDVPIEIVKPYLRSLSDMTEDEYNEFKDLTPCGRWCDDYDKWAHWGVEVVAYEYDETDKPYYNFVDFQELLDWLNAHHFDFRGLIKKGLAIEAPNNMYK